MDDDRDDAVVDRLRAAGRQPVSPRLARDVLHRAQGPAGWFRSTRAKVAAAAAGGFLVGSVGFASAGTLPAPVQEVAHDALGAVGINVPPGHDRYNGPECGGTYRNHGEYVRSHKDDPNAGASPCGKPVTSLKGSADQGAGDEPDAAEAGDAGRKGPPPWAGNGKGKDKIKDKGDKVRGQDGEEGDEDEDGGKAEEEEAPATTVAPSVTTAPTTTAPPSTLPVETTTTMATSTTSTTAAPATTSTTAAPPGATTVP